MRWFLSLIQVFLNVLVCLTGATGVVLAIVTLSFWWLLIAGGVVVMFAFAEALVAVSREALDAGEEVAQ